MKCRFVPFSVYRLSNAEKFLYNWASAASITSIYPRHVPSALKICETFADLMAFSFCNDD